MLKFIGCCEAAGEADEGYYVDADSPVDPALRGAVSEPIPDREFVPTIGVCLHEAAHALHLHARGYRIARAQVGQRNFIERAPGEGERMGDLEHVEAALAGDVGAGFAMFRTVYRIADGDIDIALDRIATGKHGTCDRCIAGFFSRHIARLTDTALPRSIWRQAESDVIELLTSGRAYSAINSLGNELREAKTMTGEAVHRHFEPYITFGSQPSNNGVDNALRN